MFVVVLVVLVVGTFATRLCERRSRFGVWHGNEGYRRKFCRRGFSVMYSIFQVFEDSRIIQPCAECVRSLFIYGISCGFEETYL